METAFRVAAASCELLLQHEKSVAAKEKAEKVLWFMDKSPTYLGSCWVSHPLRKQFEAVACAAK